MRDLSRTHSPLESVDAELSRENVVRYARSWTGVKYRHQGRNRGSGIDCVGLLYVTAQHFGLKPVDMAGYARVPEGQTLPVQLRKRLREKPKSECKIGDVLLFEMRGHLRHVAILSEHPSNLEGFSMIHAECLRQRVLEHALDEKWWRVAHNCFAFPGIDD